MLVLQTPFLFDQDTEVLVASLVQRLQILKEHGLKLQGHPLGFVKIPLQIDQKRTQDGTYIHVWLPDLPHQEGGPYIHTHVFTMRSYILFLDGAFLQKTYSVQMSPEGPYHITSAIPYERSSDLGAHIGKANIDLLQMEHELQGQIYTMLPDVFHQTEVKGRAITFVEKKNFHHALPLLAIPSSQLLPIQSFDHTLPQQDMVWDFVFSALRDFE